VDFLYKQISLIQRLRYKHFLSHLSFPPYHDLNEIIVKEKMHFVIEPVV
jgi:hypothetical protein